MKRTLVSWVFGAAVICAAPAFADDPNGANNSPSMTNSHAIHKKLMKDCMDQQKAQNSGGSTADARKSCQAQVKTQMEQMNSAGTVPPSSVPQKSNGSTTSSGTADSSSQD